MQGRATSLEGAHARTLSNHQLCHKFGIGNFYVELRIRRLKWLQHVVSHPDESVQLLSCVFGRLREGDAIFEEGGR
eukprot:3357319-Pyramimonas_sp.AAC.1